MSVSGQMNGVTRCIQVLANAFSRDKAFHVTWIHFETGIAKKHIHQLTQGYTKIIVPLPSPLGLFLTDESKKQLLWSETLTLMGITTVSEEPVIIHIHTLNLIEFALWVKRQHPCRIITHLHCIPWKALYNRDLTRFLKLYDSYYVQHDYTNRSDYIFREYEMACYTDSDCIVCVTQCAKEFIRKMFPDKEIPVKVVYNGIEDFASWNSGKVNSHPSIRCLFVGNSQSGKGLEYILQSLEIVRQRYDLTLYVVGAYSNLQQMKICKRHPFLDIRFTGLLPLIQLRHYYRFCDIGLIASLQEQCSYVAIEMMMFGLPIVSTVVDGLDELFPNGHYAKRIPLIYTAYTSLRPDTSKMADAIVQLIREPEKRTQLCANVRRRYRAKFQEKKMTRSIKHIYQQLFKQ